MLNDNIFLRGFMGIGFSELLLILVIVFVLFGAGKLPQVMNDLGRGIKGLKKGLKDEKSEEEKKPEDKNS
jgi:sec-independent protein translocase protein TatA